MRQKLKFVEPVSDSFSSKQRTIVDQFNKSNVKFCSFCVIEGHIKEILEHKKRGSMKVRPLGIYLLFKHIGGGAFFELGEQCDAAEFLYFLLGDMIQASFGYLKNIPLSYENNHLTFIP